MLRLRVIRVATRLASVYVGRNRLPYAELPLLAARLYTTLTRLSSSDGLLPTEAEIARSVRRSRIVSFIDGKPYKTLRHHLSQHGLTPEDYRRRYGLPDDYPMVAPSYTFTRQRHRIDD